MSIIRNGFQDVDLDIPVVLPTLNLDFANSQELDPRITFTRGSVGTFVNKNGLIETTPANQPRFDYDPISGECRGLLIEESRQNLFTNSEDFTSWINEGCSVSTSQLNTVSPNNTYTSNLIVMNLGSVLSLRRTWTATIGQTYYISMYFKKYNHDYVRISYFNAGSVGATQQAVVLNLNTGETSPSGFSQNLGNGWYRVWSYITPTASNTGVRFTLTNSFGGNYIGNGTSGVYVWGAQLEAGAFPTSYIPTSGSQVTRSADNADMTGSNFTSWANSSAGTFVIRVRGGQSTTQSLRGRFVGLGANGSIGLEGASTRFGIWDTTITFSVTNNSADVVNRNSNIAASFDGTLRRIVLNGVASSGISRRNINTIFTQISLGKSGVNTNYLNGTLSRVAYYPRQLNDAQMLYLTQ